MSRFRPPIRGEHDDPFWMERNVTQDDMEMWLEELMEHFKRHPSAAKKAQFRGVYAGSRNLRVFTAQDIEWVERIDEAYGRRLAAGFVDRLLDGRTLVKLRKLWVRLAKDTERLLTGDH